MAKVTVTVCEYALRGAARALMAQSLESEKAGYIGTARHEMESSYHMHVAGKSHECDVDRARKHVARLAGLLALERLDSE